MPKIQISEFPKPPSIGDKVTVKGEVKSIDEATGEVELSYDSVKINNKSKRDRESDNDNDEADDLPEEMAPNTHSLDEALANAFPNTQ